MISGTPLRVWQWGIFALLVAYPVAMILLATSNGPGISPDSVSYAAAATSFANEGRLFTFDGSPLALFPPGLSVTVGGLMSLGVSLDLATVVLNAVATGVIVATTFYLARLVLRSNGWALGAVAAVALSSSTIRIGSFLWTEPVFTALLTVVLLLLARGVALSRFSWPVVVAMGVLMSVATTFRYVGVVAVPVIAAFVALRGGQQRLAKSLSVVVLSSLGFGVVVLRNVSLGSPPLGERYPGSVGIEGALQSLTRTWGGYLAPERTTSLTVVVGGVMAVVVLLGMWVVVISRNAAGLVLAVFVLVYWSAIVFSQVGTRLDIGSERFGAPVLAPTVIIVLLAIRTLLAAMARQLDRSRLVDERTAHVLLAASALIVAIAVGSLSVVHSVRFVADGRSNGLGLNAASVANSDIARAAVSTPQGLAVVTNDPWAVWWNRGGVVLSYPPSRTDWPDSRIESDLERIEDVLETNGRVAVLLETNGSAYLEADALRAEGIEFERSGAVGSVLTGEVLLAR